MDRLVKNEFDRKLLIQLINDQKLPFTASILKGKQRTIYQNRLQRLWINEITEQLGDRTAEEVRGDIKLRFGVPILRAENEAFREKYDRLIKHLPYETKIELMMEPINFPVSRLLKTEQFTRFLDNIHRFFTEKGIALTLPPDEWGLPGIGKAA